MLRALVRNAATGRAGVQTATMKVPAVPGGPATVLPPFFEEAPGRWTMVKGNPRPDAPRKEAEYPFAVGGQSFIPSVLPAVANGTETKVAVAAYNFAGAGKPLRLRAEIVGADGAARPVEVASLRQSDTERDGGQKIAFGFKPEGLSPGRYVLKVAVTDEAGTNAEAVSAFEVRVASPSPSPLSRARSGPRGAGSRGARPRGERAGPRPPSACRRSRRRPRSPRAGAGARRG